MMHNLFYLFCQQKKKKKKKKKTRLIPALNDKKFAEDENATTPSFKISCEALQSLKLGGFGFRCYKKLCSGSAPLNVDAHRKHLPI
jgi:ribosomal protein L28